MGCLRRLIAIFLGSFFVLSYISVVNGEHKDVVDEVLDFFAEGDHDWKEVLTPEESRSFPESYPAQQFDNEPSSLPKRRRLRKRKRRPVTSTTEIAESYEEYYRGSQPKDRQKVPALQDPLQEMLNEPQATYHNRRKIPPEYEVESVNPTLTASLKFAIGEVEKVQPTAEKFTSSESTEKNLDIKALLKQSGKVSLSEILQKRNLTLSELLKGNRKAIQALKSTTTSFAESQKDEQKIVQAHMEFDPPKLRTETRKGAINRNFDHEDRFTEVFKEEDAIKPLSTRKYNNMYSGVTKFDVIAEPTTEKRIFVPSHPLLYTAINYRNQPPILAITTTPAPKSTTTKKTNTDSSFGSSHKNLPLTNAKLNKRIQLKDTFPQETKHEIKTTLPPNAIRIDVTELFGYKTKTFDLKYKENNIENNSQPNIFEGPLRFSLDIEATTTTTTTTVPTTTKLTTTTKKVEVKTTQKVEKLPSKYKPLTPRDEIIQIIKNPEEKDNLMSILEKRNMTLEELIDLRKRGSSHTHLADIFHNKTKEPEPSGETYVGHMEITKNYSMRKQKSFLDDVKTTTSTTTLKPTVIPQKVIITSFPSVKIEMQKDVPERRKVNEERIIIPDLIHFTNSKEDDRIVLLDNNFLEDNIPVQNSDSKLYVPSEPLLLDEEVFVNVPSGVKSAILASFSIIGLSILVFLSILVVFKYNQKRKNKFNYGESFGFNKSTKSSIISVPNQKIKTFVNETLGKKKNPYNSYMHTSMDNLWESKLRNY